MSTEAHTALKLVGRWSHHLNHRGGGANSAGWQGDECFHPTPADNSACRTGVIGVLDTEMATDCAAMVLRGATILMDMIVHVSETDKGCWVSCPPHRGNNRAHTNDGVKHWAPMPPSHWW